VNHPEYPRKVVRVVIFLKIYQVYITTII